MMENMMEMCDAKGCQGVQVSSRMHQVAAPWKQLWLARRKLLEEPDEVRALGAWLVAASSLPKSAKD